jgi:hypothetical protein
MRRIVYDVSEFEGYVRARTLSHYNSLPDYARVYISIEDCVQDGLLFIHKVLNRLENRKFKYDSSKSKLSTIVYQILETYFNHLCKRHYEKKRSAVFIAIDSIEGVENLLKTSEQQTNHIRINEAIDKIVRMHLDTPEHILTFIAQNIYFPKGNRFTITAMPDDVRYEKNVYTKTFRKKKLCKEEIINKRCKEFRQLASKYGVSREDYRLALSVEMKHHAH